MNRTQKEEKVADLRRSFSDAAMVVIAHQKGLTVGESNDLRRQMRAVGATFRVTKNRLARIALKGTRFEGLADMFTGQTAVAFSQDPVAAAKVAVDYAKRNEKLSIVGGGLGSQALDPRGVESLATLPSLDELRARLLGMLKTPATRIAGVLAAPGAQLARVISAHAAKEGPAADAA